jgi:hypothetical protein
VLRCRTSNAVLRVASNKGEGADRNRDDGVGDDEREAGPGSEGTGVGTNGDDVGSCVERQVGSMLLPQLLGRMALMPGSTNMMPANRAMPA